MPDQPSGRFPGYDVLRKRQGPSWNAKTREAVDARLAVDDQPRFFTAEEFSTVQALAARIAPQPKDRPPVPVAGLVDRKLHQNKQDGFRRPGMPREREAWQQGLRALDAEARAACGLPFVRLDATEQDKLLRRMQEGALKDAAWGSMSSEAFFKQRLAHDIVLARYAHPSSWSEIGWGGPASPRGYVRMGYDERDPWEAAEVKDGDVAAAQRKNRRVG